MQGVISLEVLVYRISPTVISKKKRSPFFVLLYVAALAALFSLPQSTEHFSVMKFFIIFGLTGFIAAGSNYLGTKRFIEYAKNHAVEVTAEGFKSVDADTTTILPWEKITSVRFKMRQGKFSKLVLKTSSSGDLDLSRYEDLDNLARELKGFIDNAHWK
jgi:hypothetical protein